MSDAPLKQNWQQTQAQFSAYIRDPSHNSRPAGIAKQRMETYRELFFNNVDSFLSSNFPVIHQILNEQQWYELVQAFFSTHRCSTPIFAEIPEEFIEYLQHERSNPNDYPFLLELAHYEWVEMALSIAQEANVIPPSGAVIEQLAEQKIALSALAWPLAYQFPVHRIGPGHLPTSTPEQPTYLVVYRDQSDDVYFLEINALTFNLLHMIQDAPGQTTQQYLDQIVQNIQPDSPQVIFQGGLQTLQELTRKGVIVCSNH